MVTTTTLAATLTVDAFGAGDFDSIGEALAAATSGDTVLVLPGVYGGSTNNALSFGGNDIVLRSSGGAQQTRIQHYSQFNSVFHIHEGESRAAVVEGFTVSNAWGYGCCPVFDIHDASPTIRDCRFIDNYAWGEHHTEGWCGVGSFYRSKGALIDCEVRDNSAHCGCGAIGIVDSRVDIQGCVFEGNYDGWEGIGTLYIRDSPASSITDCLFMRNRGSSSCIYTYGSYLMDVTNCTFVDNGDSSYDGVIHAGAAAGPVLITNCIFAFNDVGCVVGDDDDAVFSWCCVYGNTCGDTLGATYVPSQVMWVDPRFCNIDAQDYTLCANSPCLPYLSGWTDLVGAYDSGCGNCSSPVKRTSWGSIKAMFR